VIWDWNGTLLDDVDLARGIVNELFVDHGVQPMSHERYIGLFDFPVRAYYERAGMDFSRVSFESLSETFCDQFERRLADAALFPAAVPVLSSVRHQGMAQYVLSGTEHGMLCRMLSDFGLQATFNGIKGMSDGLASGKISGGRDLIAEFGIEADGTLMIGDTTHDFEVARELGLDCALLTTGHQSAERLLETGCPVFGSLDSISQHLSLPAW